MAANVIAVASLSSTRDELAHVMSCLTIRCIHRPGCCFPRRRTRVPIGKPKKELLVYDRSIHNYTEDPPVWTEIRPGHFILALELYRAELGQ